ncbi:MAG: hypothetical protein KIT87_13520 [Anaerolineae bacterium]|nr:hypothetical protein [Anaerolineae bacterium]
MRDIISQFNDLAVRRADLAEASQAQLDATLVPRHLHFGGRPLATVLRPHFLTQAEYDYVRHEGALLLGAFDRAYRRLLADADFRAQMDLTPEEETLIQVYPGYDTPTPTGRIDTFFVHGGTLQAVEYNAETPAATAYEDELSDVFLNLPLMTEFGKDYYIQPLTARWQLIGVLRDLWWESGGRGMPQVAIVDWDNVPTYSEFELWQDYFTRHGIQAIITTPQAVEYRQGALYSGDFRIDVIYKRVLGSELLQAYGLNHPILDAYRDGKVVMFNPYRCKLLHKKMSFAVLSDDANQGLFTAEQQRAIREHIPWTRKVAEMKTTRDGQSVDLIPHIVQDKDDLVLKPNDEYGGKGVVIGWESSPGEWETAVQDALKTSYIVQAKVNIAREDYPAWANGQVVIGERLVDLDPFVWRGQYVHGALTRLSAQTLLNVTAGGGSTVPTLLIEPRA